MLIVTHEMGFAAHVADRIAFIDDGRIVDEGPPRHVFHHSKRAAGAAVPADLPRPQQFLRAASGLPREPSTGPFPKPSCTNSGSPHPIRRRRRAIQSSVTFLAWGCRTLEALVFRNICRPACGEKLTSLPPTNRYPRRRLTVIRRIDRRIRRVGRSTQRMDPLKASTGKRLRRQRAGFAFQPRSPSREGSGRTKRPDQARSAARSSFPQLDCPWRWRPDVRRRAQRRG